LHLDGPAVGNADCLWWEMRKRPQAPAEAVWTCATVQTSRGSLSLAAMARIRSTDFR
jgi:hypothetical protein